MNSDLPDEYLIAIGRVAVSFGRLDSMLTHTLIFTLLGDFQKDGRALATFAHMAFPQKMQALESMLNIVSPQLAKAYCDDVKGLLDNASKKRNAFLHQHWISEDYEVKRVIISARRSLEVDAQSVGIEELAEASLLSDEARVKLLMLASSVLELRLSPQQGQ